MWKKLVNRVCGIALLKVVTYRKMLANPGLESRGLRIQVIHPSSLSSSPSIVTSIQSLANAAYTESHNRLDRYMGVPEGTTFSRLRFQSEEQVLTELSQHALSVALCFDETAPLTASGGRPAIKLLLSAFRLTKDSHLFRTMSACRHVLPQALERPRYKSSKPRTPGCKTQ